MSKDVVWPIIIGTAQVPSDCVEKAGELIVQKELQLKEQYQLKESQLSLTFDTTSCAADTVLRQECAKRLVALLLVLPHGVAKMSHAVPGMSSQSPLAEGFASQHD